MKTFVCGISGLTFLFFLLSTSIGFTSCTKEILVRDTIEFTKVDTLILKDTTLSIQILTANSWKLLEYKGVVGGDVVNYIRGGTNNNINFDQEYIIFKSDKTGTYYDAAGFPSSLTWNFSNAENTKIQYTVNFPVPGPTIVTWENIRYKNGSLYYDQYWSQEKINSHTQNIRIPK